MAQQKLLLVDLQRGERERERERERESVWILQYGNVYRRGGAIVCVFGRAKFVNRLLSGVVRCERDGLVECTCQRTRIARKSKHFDKKAEIFLILEVTMRFL